MFCVHFARAEELQHEPRGLNWGDKYPGQNVWPFWAVLSFPAAEPFALFSFQPVLLLRSEGVSLPHELNKRRCCSESIVLICHCRFPKSRQQTCTPAYQTLRDVSLRWQVRCSHIYPRMSLRTSVLAQHPPLALRYRYCFDIRMLVFSSP